MKIFVTAKPRAKEASVKEICLPAGEVNNPSPGETDSPSSGETSDLHFVVAVSEPPVAGRANRAIIKALADFLNIAPSRLRIVSGHSRRRKVIEVLEK